MLEDHLARISSASEILANSIRVYSAALAAFGSEVETHYKSGLLKDRLILRSLVSMVDGPLETIASHTSHLHLIQTSLRKTKNKMIPINSLHPELLAGIFSLIPDDNPPVANMDVFGSYPADSSCLGLSANLVRLSSTITLSNVCGYWRNITLGIGTLWSYIPLHVAGRATQCSLDRAPVWLDRARTTPLDVFLFMDGFRETASSRTMLDKVLDLSLGSKRVRTLYLSLATTAYTNNLLKNCSNDDTFITLMKLYVDIYEKIDEPSKVQDWLTQCKALQVLQLSVGTLCSDLFPVLPTLVELELFANIQVSLTVEQLTAILRACPSLQRLKLSDIELENSIGIHLAPVSSSHLKVLILQYVDLASILPLISSKSTSLGLSIADEMQELSSDNLTVHIGDFSRRTTVRTLQLDGDGTAWLDLHIFLRLFPHVITLSLQNIQLNNVMVGTLRVTSDEETATSPFPNLQVIWLTESLIEDEEVLRLLVSLCPLKQLKLNNCCFAPARTITEAKELCSYLLEAVSDLEIVNYDEDGKDVHFP
ncbi:hypothetical protein BDV93DRAFT_604659 [Ceratobasidium sp. AG-I]|nr:hypothetical protein BDV93DRAFT_604659 [Ceratobasidium sp. AG-I]